MVSGHRIQRPLMRWNEVGWMFGYSSVFQPWFLMFQLRPSGQVSLWCCSWGPCSYQCGLSDQDGFNYPQPFWSSISEVGIESPPVGLDLRHWVWKRGARSSAKSKLPIWVQEVQWISFPLWAVDVLNTKSMASRNRDGDSGHSCVYLQGICQLATTDHSAHHSTTGISNDAVDLLWYAIVYQKFPEAQSVQTVKRLLTINKTDMVREVPFAWLF